MKRLKLAENDPSTVILQTISKLKKDLEDLEMLVQNDVRDGVFETIWEEYVRLNKDPEFLANITVWLRKQ